MFPGLRLKVEAGMGVVVGAEVDGVADRSLLAKSDDIGKKLIFLGSRNSKALKCRTQGQLCDLPHRTGFDN